MAYWHVTWLITKQLSITFYMAHNGKATNWSGHEGLDYIYCHFSLLVAATLLQQENTLWEGSSIMTLQIISLFACMPCFSVALFFFPPQAMLPGCRSQYNTGKQFDGC